MLSQKKSAKSAQAASVEEFFDSVFGENLPEIEGKSKAERRLATVLAQAYRNNPTKQGRLNLEKRFGETKFFRELISQVEYDAAVSKAASRIREISPEVHGGLASAVSDALNYIAAEGSNEEALRLIKTLRQFLEPTESETTLRVIERPTSAHVLYPGAGANLPSEFLKENWQEYIDAGVLYQHTLRKLDPKLMMALDNEFRGRREELKALLPPKSAETDRLLEEHGYPTRSGTRRVVAAALRKAQATPKP